MREAPSRGPFLFQDVVGLAQGLLGGGAQVKFSRRIPPARLRGWELLVDTDPCLGTTDTWKLAADNTEGLGRRPAISKGKCLHRRIVQTGQGLVEAGAHTSTHRGDSLYSLYTELGAHTGLTSPTIRVLSTKQRYSAPHSSQGGREARRGKAEFLSSLEDRMEVGLRAEGWWGGLEGTVSTKARAPVVLEWASEVSVCEGTLVSLVGRKAPPVGTG